MFCCKSKNFMLFKKVLHNNLHYFFQISIFLQLHETTHFCSSSSINTWFSALFCPTLEILMKAERKQWEEVLVEPPGFGAPVVFRVQRYQTCCGTSSDTADHRCDRSPWRHTLMITITTTTSLMMHPLSGMSLWTVPALTSKAPTSSCL